MPDHLSGGKLQQLLKFPPVISSWHPVSVRVTANTNRNYFVGTTAFNAPVALDVGN